MLRFLSSVMIAGMLATTQLPALAQPAATPAAMMRQATPGEMMANPGAAAKGILIETKDEALARRVLSIVKGAPAQSYRAEGYQTVQYGSLPLADLQKTKEMARSIIIVVGPRWRIIIVLGARAAAYQQKVLTALAAVDKSTYTLDVAK